MVKYLLFLISSVAILGCASNRPRIECADLNNMSADTSYYISTRKYEGFIFPKDYEPMFEVGEGRYTPTFSQVNRAEIILLKKGKKYGSAYKRQYIGSITPSGDTLMNLRLLKNGFREECFDRIVAFGFHGRYEKNQSVKTVNLSTGKIEK